MTSHDGSPPQISWWYVVVVPADLVDPSVAWAAQTTPPAYPAAQLLILLSASVKLLSTQVRGIQLLVS